VWVPAALGGHRNHRVVRTTVFSLLAALPKATVWLYAEYPYHQHLVRGWRPAQATHRAGPTADALRDWFAHHLASGQAGTKTALPAHVLAAPALEAKRAAVGCYGSQLKALDDTLGGRLLEDELLGTEYAWCLRSSSADRCRADAG
jgi:hypothetical protein